MFEPPLVFQPEQMLCQLNEKPLPCKYHAKSIESEKIDMSEQMPCQTEQIRKFLCVAWSMAHEPKKKKNPVNRFGSINVYPIERTINIMRQKKKNSVSRRWTFDVSPIRIREENSKPQTGDES